MLWAVISKTIPWMAALIENNEGHIEHMVAVVSPFPPFFFFHFHISMILSLLIEWEPLAACGLLCCRLKAFCAVNYSSQMSHH